MAGEITLIARIRAAKGKADALEQVLKEMVEVVRREEPGCLAYRPHRSPTDPDLFIFYEQYKDAAAREFHSKGPHLVPYRERRQREGLQDGPPQIEVFIALTD